ncbi:MAG: acetyl-CoA carboxylase biotin carboxyl carrier protein [Sporichthyaceae bacterium]
MALSPPDIKAILDALEASDWDSASVSVDGVTIAVSRNGAALPGSPAAAPTSPPPPAPALAAPTAAAPAAAAPAAAAPAGHVVTAPSVGVFWRSPRPGAPPFVEVGQRVEVGDTVCIVEMMKLMTNVASDVAGVITAVHQQNAAQVEFGAPLVSIDPAS